MSSVEDQLCAEDGCLGVAFGEGELCLAHQPPDELQVSLEAIHRDGGVDARGVTINAPLLARIVTALSRSDGKVSFRWADFSGATFKDDIDLAGATFEGPAIFDGAKFCREVRLRDTAFKGDADFGWTTFCGDAWFSGGVFESLAWFDGANFETQAVFGGRTFKGAAEFGRATFKWAGFDHTTFRDASFANATFEGDAVFAGAVFEDPGEFRSVTFKGDTRFEGAVFKRDAFFSRTKFERTRNFGPMLVIGMLSLGEAVFTQAADLRVSANRLALQGAQFPEGANIWARWAEVALDDANFGVSSIFAGGPRFVFDPVSAALKLSRHSFKERALVRELKRTGVRSMRSGRPRVLSLRRADVRNLTLSNVDLRPCRFSRAHGVDQLRIDATSTFPGTPSARGVTRRRTIAEEHEWRAGRSNRWWRSKGWNPPECECPDWACEDARTLPPSEIAALYRELRKEREDRKDEPGAADFYYGEMEMRRLDASRPLAERVILWLYWLVSGYGLRASRALVSLLLTVFVFAALLDMWGFPSNAPGGADTADVSFLEALTFSAESTTSLLRAPDRPLTLPGHWFQIGLRLLGPLFFALALLSLRGRVKR